jgi:hypothetical protein
MKITRAGTSLLAMLALMLAPTIAHAQFTVYTNLADYLAAVSAPATDTYDDLALDEFSEFPFTRTVSSYSYQVSAPLGTYVVGTEDDSWLSTNEETDILTLDNFSGGVAGIGGFFFATNFDGDVLPGTQLVLTVSNNGGTSVFDVTSAGPSDFRGFVSLNGNITSLSVAASESFSTVNDLVLGGSTVVVPEPTAFALLVAGACGLALSARRRRTR